MCVSLLTLLPQNSEGIDKGRFTAGLSFTEAVIRETLRLYSVVPMLVRTPIEDDEYEGMRIPKGTWVAIMVRAIHLRPDLWEKPTVRHTHTQTVAYTHICT